MEKLQPGAPCRIGIERRDFPDLNFISTAVAKRGVSATRKKPPPARQNVIKIRLSDNPKDIIIKFPDKETLIKSLRDMLNL